MGNNLISLKGDGGWRGKTCIGTTDRGARRFLKLENCYVHGDGGELRHFPGFSTILDLSDENNGAGYGRILTEAVRNVFATSPSETYQYYYSGADSNVQTLRSFAKMAHLHWFEQIGNTLLIGGESHFRQIPVYKTRVPAVLLTVAYIVVSSGRWVLRMSDNVPTSNGERDTDGASLNGLKVGQVIYVSGDLRVGDSALQTAIDTNLARFVHEVKAISGNDVTLHTTTSATSSGTAVTNTTPVYLTRVAFNRDNLYSTPSGVYPWTSTLNNRPTDPDALTSWRVIAPLSRTNTALSCHPAWVANRQRDFGDQVGSPDIEGVWLDSTGTRGVSRREGRQLPYRMNPDCATDRVLIAAPGYGCMFQIPLKIPTQPDFDYPAPSPGGDDYGPLMASNSIYDKPRSLGIPKGRLIDSLSTPAPPSPSDTTGYNFNLTAIVGSPEFGLTPGEYWVSIAYEDEALGEEGLASEPIIVTVPSNQYAYAININYIHPGYIMPECLATKVNVYLSAPGEEAMAFYASFPLCEIGSTVTTVNDSSYSMSGVYGFEPCSPMHSTGIYHQIRLPMIGSGDLVEDVLDAERLAPQSSSMPRGAECVRYVRGVMIAGGAPGNSGGAMQLWQAKASMRFEPLETFDQLDEMYIKVHGEDLTVPNATQDGDAQTSTLGIAGRAFPDAYQGIEVVSKELWPVGSVNQRIDRVVNRRSWQIQGSSSYFLHFERVRLSRDVFDRIRTAGTSPSTTTSSQSNKDVWYVMPRGQIQLGDPGAPWRSSKSSIQITDPKRGDDIVAIGEISGNVIVCSQCETYSFSWYRNAGSEIPNLVHSKYGCIAANSMVEFDGGLAWLSEHGPVAMGATLQHVGIDVHEDFDGSNPRYLCDSRGMMRHAWGCHDMSRSIVMWGLVTDETQELFYTNEVTGDYYTWDELDDGGKSRMPCDEVLIWNYKTNAFSTWRPPSGLEIYWMRQLRDEDGVVRTCFLARDGRIYALDDVCHDTAMTVIEGTVTARQITESTTLAFTISVGTGQNGTAPTGHNGDRRHLRAGMLVEIIDLDGDVVHETTIASITTVSSSGGTIVMTDGATWKEGYAVRIGARQRATIIGTYLGAETMDNLSVQGVQMRYSLEGTGTAHARVSAYKTEFTDEGPTPRTIAFSPQTKWTLLGDALTSTDESMRVSRRRTFKQGGVDAQEVAVKIELSGSSQTRIQDIALEVG